MLKDSKDFLKLSGNSIYADVRMVSFKEGDHFIMYIPSLNLSSYGDSEEEAKMMMQEVVIKDFCESVVKNKNRAFVIAELKKLGWAPRPFFKKELSRNSYIDKEGILRDFDLSSDTVINEEKIEIAC